MRMAKCPGQHSWLPLWGNVVLGVAAAIVESLDGQLKDPGSEMEQANQLLVDMESDSRLTIFKVGINADAVQAMQRVLPNPNSRFQPQQLHNLRFSDFFVWLSKSVSAISRSTPGDTVNLPPTDWTTIHV